MTETTAASSDQAPDDLVFQALRPMTWCSKRALDQCQDTCFATSVLLLLSKLEYLYRDFNEPSREYIDSIRECPRLTENMCQKIPIEILDEYKKLHPQGISFKLKGGGIATVMLIAILKANAVPHRHLTIWDDMSEMSDVYPVPSYQNRTLSHFKRQSDQKWFLVSIKTTDEEELKALEASMAM